MVVRDLHAVTTPCSVAYHGTVVLSAPQQHAKRASLTCLLTGVDEYQQDLKGGKNLGLKLCWKG